MATNATEVLESLINEHGLLHVLTGLELVCREKAALGLDGKLTAGHWEQAADTMENAARRVHSGL